MFKILTPALLASVASADYATGEGYTCNPDGDTSWTPESIGGGFGPEVADDVCLAEC
jgi:hypothetical protein